MQFEITANPAALDDKAREEAMADPAFGRVFTDHMVISGGPPKRDGMTPA